MSDSFNKNDDKESELEISNFIRESIKEDNRTGKWGGKVITRFPPEPNGYLHIGHAKAISISYGMAEEFGGEFHLRFDDTNPSKEEHEYIESILCDVKWLGADYGKHVYYASDYFEQMYGWAIVLIKASKAFVCDLNADQIREYRGTLTQPGKESPYRNRSVEENLDLFARMKVGEFSDGSRTLRAKIDMASPNINLRDPVMYRIMHMSHYRQESKYCIYPTYDWAHGLEDSIEGITHSLCDLSFEDHRPLYDWYLDQLKIHHPQQIEFAKLNISYTLMSKRNLRQLVADKIVSGWDDPRLPTLSGLRRRGFSPEAIRAFCERIGVAKRDSLVDLALLEFHIRENLNKVAQRVMGVMRPLKVVIDNYPEGQVEEVDAVNNPEDQTKGTRKVPFTKELYIEQDDFMEVPAKKYFRLYPGNEVRLRYAYFITCQSTIKDAEGNIIELHCTYDPLTKGGAAPDGRSPKATIHWVSAKHAIDAELRLVDKLFIRENMNILEEGKAFTDYLNPTALEILKNAKVEPFLTNAKPGDRYQFERKGYFSVDPDSKPDKLVFNRTVTLKDTWAKIEKKR